MRNSRSNH